MSASRRVPVKSHPPAPPAPAILRLVQLVVLGRWRATGEQLYREVARVTDIQPGQEVLVSGCGDGVTGEADGRVGDRCGPGRGEDRASRGSCPAAGLLRAVTPIASVVSASAAR